MEGADRHADWWQPLYDDTVAEMFLVRKDEVLRATVAFLREQLDLGPNRSVFDQCCGIGSLSIPLARTGVRVVGVDQSAAYIQRARVEARTANLPCTFLPGDAIDFVPAEPCDAAFNWETGFGNADDVRNQQMLQRVFEALKPGGRFLLDYQNVPRILRHFQECLVHRQTMPAGEVLLLRESTIDLPGGWLRQHWTFLMPDGRRCQRATAVRLYLPHDLAAMLRRCGFQDITFHGGVRGEPLGLDSPRCICAARRPS